MPVKLIFSFDWRTTSRPKPPTPRSGGRGDDLHGITACINLVGELARSLRDRGRRDVIEAIGRNEICYHSDMH